MTNEIELLDVFMRHPVLLTVLGLALIVVTALFIAVIVAASDDDANRFLRDMASNAYAFCCIPFELVRHAIEKHDERARLRIMHAHRLALLEKANDVERERTLQKWLRRPDFAAYADDDDVAAAVGSKQSES